MINVYPNLTAPFWWITDIIWLGAIAAALTGIIRFVPPAWRTLTGAVRTINSLTGLPDFMEKTTATLEAQDQKIAEIHHEVQFNNGSSVKDAVTRVETVLTQNTRKLTTQIAAQRRIEKGVAGLYTRVDANELAANKDRADIAAARQELEDTRPTRTIKPKE